MANLRDTMFAKMRAAYGEDATYNDLVKIFGASHATWVAPTTRRAFYKTALTGMAIPYNPLLTTDDLAILYWNAIDLRAVPAPKVVWYGKAGSFPSALLARTTNANGHPLTTRPIYTSMSFYAGELPYFPQRTADGTLHFGANPQTVNVFQPTATRMLAHTYSPVTQRLTTYPIPSTKGEVDLRSQVYQIVGGGDHEDSVVYFKGAEERVLHISGRPYNDWSLATYGELPVFTVMRKNALGEWYYSADDSRTPRQVYQTNPAKAGYMYRQSTTPVTGESFYHARHTTEADVFPASGHIVIGHYDDSSGDSQRSGGFSVVDSDLTLRSTYLVPNVTAPDGALLSVRPRGIWSAPESSLNDERFICCYDVFNGALSPNGVTLDGGSGAGIFNADSAAWNVSGLMEITMRVKATDWTPASGMYLMAHHEPTGNQRSWAYFLNTDGTFLFTTSSNGVDAPVNVNSTAPSLVDGTTFWIGMSYNTTTGAMSFYKANDQATEPTRWSGWTLISTSTVATTVLFDASNGMSIGGSSGFLSNKFVGTVYRGTLYDDGVAIANPDFTTTGNPTAYPLATSYTDSAGVAWTIGGTAVIAGTDSRNFMMQEFSYNASAGSITAKSKPFWGGVAANRPHQGGFDELGNFYMTTSFGGIFNGFLYVYEKVAGERKHVTSAPAAAAPWLNGLGGTTTEWDAVVAPSANIAGTAIGGNASGVTWDTLNKVMYMTTGTSGIVALQRTGGAAPYTYTFKGQCELRQSDTVSTSPIRAILDPTTRLLWVVMATQQGGGYPQAPTERPHWLISVALDFWL